MKVRRVVTSLLLLGMFVGVATVGATAQVGSDEPETSLAPLGATSPVLAENPHPSTESLIRTE